MHIVNLKKIGYGGILYNQILRNNNICGEGWVNNAIMNGKTISWDMFTIMEASEALNAIACKSMGDIYGKVDIENIKIGLVDLLRYLLSKCYEDVWHEGIVREEAVEEIGDYLDNALEYTSNDIEVIDKQKFMNTVMTFKSKLLGYMHSNSSLTMPHTPAYYKTNQIIATDDQEELVTEDKPSTSTEQVKLSSKTKELISTFGNLVELIPNFTTIDILKLYIGRNILNTFRQENNYADRIYTRNWEITSGVFEEDNVFMQKVMNDLTKKTSIIDLVVVRDRLTELYKSRLNK